MNRFACAWVEPQDTVHWVHMVDDLQPFNRQPLFTSCRCETDRFTERGLAYILLECFLSESVVVIGYYGIIIQL